MRSSAQCCGSKFIEFGSGSRILAHFGSGIQGDVIKQMNNFREEQFSLKNQSLLKLPYKKILAPKERL